MFSSIARNLLKLSKQYEHGVSLIRPQIRNNSVIAASKLIYREYGDPIKVVEKQDENVNVDIKQNEVLVKMLASPVNPADINTIQGKYPVRPTLPSVPGNEGVGEVVAVGKLVSSLAVGDRVVPLTNALGTWQTHLILPGNLTYKIPDKLGLVEAATLTVNPCTAYRMLKDFVDLKPGDTVIQNGGNSACGQNAIQICRVWGVNTVNIVRDRPDIEELKNYLCKLGSTFVLTEEELRCTTIFKDKVIPKPRLALNCVGGKSSLELLRHVANGGTMVTYGGMSRDPVTVPTGALIFKDIAIRGFWMTEWTKKYANSPERTAMLKEITSMMIAGEIQSPLHTMIPFSNFKEALLNTMNIKGMIGKKFVLDFCSSN